MHLSTWAAPARQGRTSRSRLRILRPCQSRDIHISRQDVHENKLRTKKRPPRNIPSLRELAVKAAPMMIRVLPKNMENRRPKRSGR